MMAVEMSREAWMLGFGFVVHIFGLSGVPVFVVDRMYSFEQAQIPFLWAAHG